MGEIPGLPRGVPCHSLTFPSGTLSHERPQTSPERVCLVVLLATLAHHKGFRPDQGSFFYRSARVRHALRARGLECSCTGVFRERLWRATSRKKRSGTQTHWRRDFNRPPSNGVVDSHARTSPIVHSGMPKREMLPRGDSRAMSSMGFSSIVSRLIRSLRRSSSPHPPTCPRCDLLQVNCAAGCHVQSASLLSPAHVAKALESDGAVVLGFYGGLTHELPRAWGSSSLRRVTRSGSALPPNIAAGRQQQEANVTCISLCWHHVQMMAMVFWWWCAHTRNNHGWRMWWWEG